VSANPNGEHQCVLLSASLGALLEPLVDSLQPFLTVNQREESQRTVVRLASTDRDSPTQREEKVTKRLALLRQMIEKIIEGRRLTILIDEADVFSQTDSALERRQSLAWLLRDLEIHNPERLRVVFAGFQELHHEVIAANGAFANWFGQCRLGPLEREEAISLIKEPLADFGVQFVSDAGMERILEFTGRYPLLIQEVCSRLMERAMARRPHSIKPGDEILTVRAGEVEMVCRDESLRTRLHQVLSLNLDKYPRLKLVTYLILQAGTHRASASDASFADVFKIEDVQARLIEWYGAKLSEYFSEVSLPGMVDELESLGLVAKHGDGYRFLNRTFASMLRDNRAFESELLSLLMQVANPTDSEPRRYASLPKEHLESLLRSPKHSLLAGLRATLKTQTVKNLFSNELGTRSHLVNEGGIIDSKSLQEAIQKRLHETRKSLSLGDLCVRHGIEVLVLDCPDLTYQALEEIARELADRAPIRLVATATPEVTRQFVTAHSDTFQLLAMRRLRAKDIIAWAEQPYRRRDGKEAVLTIDENTAAALLKATCGYFPLLLKFREYCEREMVKAMAYYPKREDVTNFQTELTGSELKDILLGELSECERTVLRRLLDEALLRDGAEPHVESERIDTLLLEIAEDDSDAWGSMIDAVEVLRHLDLMTEQLPNYNLDNAGLLRQAFEA